MRALLPALPFLLLGCRPDFENVADACPKSFPGMKEVPDATAKVFERINCWRRLAKAGPAKVDDIVTDTVTSHARYTVQNGVFAPDSVADPYIEFEGKPGFTGLDLLSRLDYHDYELEPGITAVWDFSLAYPIGGVEFVDLFVHEPVFRELILQMGWIDGGWAELPDPEHSGMQVINAAFIFEFPAEDDDGRIVSFPKEGQTDVPVSLVSLYPTDYAAVNPGGPIGYPITLTVGAEEAAGAFNSANPYKLYVSGATSIEGPGGMVDHAIIQPTVGSMRYSVILVPKAPLVANTEYTVKAALTWTFGDKDVEFTFKTGDQAIDTYTPYLGSGNARPPELRIEPRAE